ncbi:MAG: cupin domain-containing protein [Hyphomicrobium sp.]|jgi:quercetin dioxygenase-like cupin family protein
MKYAFVIAALVALTSSAVAHDTGDGHPLQEIQSKDLTYRDDPAFAKGGQTVVLVGDPKKPGLFILRLKMDPHFVVLPHTHPVFETVTVLKGTMGSGMGEKTDLTKGKLLGPGSVLALPAGHPHYVWAGDEEVILQVVANGPFDINYINPDDDPRLKK